MRITLTTDIVYIRYGQVGRERYSRNAWIWCRIAYKTRTVYSRFTLIEYSSLIDDRDEDEDKSERHWPFVYSVIPR